MTLNNYSKIAKVLTDHFFVIDCQIKIAILENFLEIVVCFFQKRDRDQIVDPIFRQGSRSGRFLN